MAGAALVIAFAWSLLGRGSLCVLALGQTVTPQIAGPADVCCTQPTASVEYGSIRNVLVVVGYVAGIDNSPQCRGSSDCLGLPQLSLKRVTSLVGKAPEQLVVDMQLPAGPDGKVTEPQTGERILLTLRADPQMRYWSCGALQPCGRKPASRWLGLELFRHLSWP